MVVLTDRRDLLLGLGAFAAAFGSQTRSGRAQTMKDSADLILFNGKITTLDRQNPNAIAVAIVDGQFVAVGSDSDILQRAATNVRRVDLNGRRVIPGLIDSHIIRGGLNYNLELRWDGVRSLADAMQMLKEQVVRTPAPQWIRVVGGFTAHQFAEKRLPTLEEINSGHERFMAANAFFEHIGLVGGFLLVAWHDLKQADEWKKSLKVQDPKCE